MSRKVLSSLFKIVFSGYFLINSSPLLAASEGGASKVACAASVSSPDSAIVGKVRAFLRAYESDLRAELDSYRSDPNNQEGILHEDSLACRFCQLSSTYIMTDLKRYFPEIEWQMRQTSGVYQGYLHVYVYAPELNLMIDSTYRQFVAENPPQNFDSLPKIFVGTPLQFKNLMKGLIPDDVLEGYINRTWVHQRVRTIENRRVKNWKSLGEAKL